MNQFSNFVREYLVRNDVKCYRHCDQPAKFHTLFESESSLVGAYACPKGLVSRVVCFSEKPDSKWFRDFLEDEVGTLDTKDIRVATRHGWELGGEAESEIRQKSGVIMQYYWTPRARTDEEEKYGVFLCSKEEGGCGKLFSKLKTDDSKLCPNCN